MSLRTHSQIIYGHTVDSENSAIDFNEGGSELQADIEVGEYTLTDYAEAVAAALNEAGALTYTVSVNRTTRKLTIAASGTFALLGATGSRVGIGAWEMMGFASADVSGAATYTGGSASGSAYNTQFILQDFIPKENWVQAVDATVSKSASGQVEVVNFGEESFIQANFKCLTDREFPIGAPIRNVSTVDDFLALMNYLITKAPVEFIADEDDPDTFDSVLLEKTPGNDKGVGFKLRELYDIGLPEFYESGPLIFRVVE